MQWRRASSAPLFRFGFSNRNLREARLPFWPVRIQGIALTYSLLGTTDPREPSVSLNCRRFGYGYHGGKHLFVCPNRPFPAPATQPLGGPPAQPISPQTQSVPTVSRPNVEPAPARVAAPVVRHVLAPASEAPKALGQVRQTGALSHLSATYPLVVAITLIVVALASLVAAIGFRRRPRPQL